MGDPPNLAEHIPSRSFNPKCFSIRKARFQSLKTEYFLGSHPRVGLLPKSLKDNTDYWNWAGYVQKMYCLATRIA